MELKDAQMVSAMHAASVVAIAALAKAVAEHLPPEDAETFLLTITADLRSVAERPGQDPLIAQRVLEYRTAVEQIPTPEN